MAPLAILTPVLTRTPVQGVPPKKPETTFPIPIPKVSFETLNRVPVLVSAILAEIKVSRTATKATLQAPTKTA